MLGGVGCNLSDGRGVFGCFWVFFCFNVLFMCCFIFLLI